GYSCATQRSGKAVTTLPLPASLARIVSIAHEFHHTEKQSSGFALHVRFARNQIREKRHEGLRWHRGCSLVTWGIFSRSGGGHGHVARCERQDGPHSDRTLLRAVPQERQASRLSGWRRARLVHGALRRRKEALPITLALNPPYAIVLFSSAGPHLPRRRYHRN